MNNGWYYFKKDEILALFTAIIHFENYVHPECKGDLIASRSPEDLQKDFKNIRRAYNRLCRNGYAGIKIDQRDKNKPKIIRLLK